MEAVMNLTLALDPLLEIFEKYNLVIWPMQWIAYLLGILALVFVFVRKSYSNRFILGVLASLWLWTGADFFFFYFGPVYTPAYVFGAMFILQGFFFLAGVARPRISFGFKRDWYAVVGLLFIAYAMLGYPLVGYLIGHIYPQSPPFGLTPCPLTVFTFGLYLLTDRKVPWGLLIIPLFWGLGGVLPVSVGILEDIGLIVAGVVGTVLLVLRDRERAA
jgi:hypothetical protein